MLYSIGRVQTPTLAILVEREKAIQSFVPQDYWQLKAELTTTDGCALRGRPGRLDKTTRFANATAASGSAAIVAACTARPSIPRPPG